MFFTDRFVVFLVMFAIFCSSAPPDCLPPQLTVLPSLSSFSGLLSYEELFFETRFLKLAV